MAAVETNPRGIPRAPFVENIADYVTPSEGVDTTLQKFTETIAKYKYMENHSLQRKGSLESKIPDIEKSLEVVKLLIEKKNAGDSIETTYELNDTLYAKAKVPPSDKVCLWLGANVMLEYDIDDALKLLTEKLDTAKKALVATNEDLEFLREQITTMEVNTARLYNWDVKQRREKKTAP